MDKNMFSDQTALILGLGETGLASALWCQRQGAQVKLLDTRLEVPNHTLIKEKFNQENLFLGPQVLNEDHLNQVDFIVLSPGLSPNEESIAQFLEQAKKRKIKVVGEVELFAIALQHLKQQQDYLPKVLAITGTNGKTTVTSLTQSMLVEAGFKAQVAGNISPSALTALMEALDENALPEVWVLELSSFQMATVQSLQPDAAVVLNISEDHLDWHRGFDDYIQHKAKLLTLSQVQIINRDDPMVLKMVASLSANNVRSFGSDLPRLESDLGLDNKRGVDWLVAAENRTPNDGMKKKSPDNSSRKEGLCHELMPANAMQLRGRHNTLNALAALSLCRVLEVQWTPLLNALNNFKADKHRMNFIRQIQGVDFIDDSKGTNVGATLAALAGLDAKQVLIMGGLAKGQDFLPLIPLIQEKVKAVLLIGQDASIIAKSLENTQVPMVFCESLNQAVQKSMAYAQTNDVVLLSPACASMDMFKNYQHRGEVFIDAVQELALDHGEMA